MPLQCVIAYAPLPLQCAHPMFAPASYAIAVDRVSIHTLHPYAPAVCASYAPMPLQSVCVSSTQDSDCSGAGFLVQFIILRSKKGLAGALMLSRILTMCAEKEKEPSRDLVMQVYTCIKLKPSHLFDLCVCLSFAVYASSTKDSDVIGVDGLARVCRVAAPMPVVAIGGIQVGGLDG